MSFRIACKTCIDFREFDTDESISTKRVWIARCRVCKEVIAVEIFDEKGESEASLYRQ